MNAYRVTVFSLFFHDGYVWITEVLAFLTVYADSPELALTKARKMTALHCELSEGRKDII